MCASELCGTPPGERRRCPDRVVLLRACWWMSSERAEIQVDASQGGGGAGSGATCDDDNAARRRLGFAQPVRDIRQQALTSAQAVMEGVTRWGGTTCCGRSSRSTPNGTTCGSTASPPATNFPGTPPRP